MSASGGTKRVKWSRQPRKGQTINSPGGGTRAVIPTTLQPQRNSGAPMRRGLAQEPGGPDAAGASEVIHAGPTGPVAVFRQLVADDLDDPAAVPAAVELEEEHPLPGPERELALTNGNRLAGGTEQHGHAVGVSVPELHVLGADVLGAPVPVVMGVVLLARDEAAEHAREVLQKPGLELVDPDTAGGMGGIHAGDPVLDAALGNAFPHLVRDVPDLETASCPESALKMKDLHVELHLH